MGAPFTGISQPKFTEKVKEFIPEHLDNLPCKNLGILVEIFENGGYSANADIDDETYLVAFLATWLRGRVFGDSSIAARPETFLMAVEMA